MATSAFERYGGFASVSKIVSTFYDKILDEPSLAEHFEGTDMRRLIDHQTKFIASVMGGPASYSNEVLERVHAGLGISEDAFFEVVDLLEEALEEYDVEAQDIGLIREEILARKNFIVTRQ